MKRNAIARIVVNSLILVVLLSVLMAGMKTSLFSSRKTGKDYGDRAQLEQTLFSEEIREIEIHWVSGQITMETGSENSICVTEDFSGDEKDAMVCHTDGKRLIIEFCENGEKGFGFFGHMPEKNLNISVPSGWEGKQVTVESASADVVMNRCTVNKIDLRNASGEGRFTECAIDELEVDTVSGNIAFSGSLNQLKCSSVSAECDFVLTNHPRKMNMDTVSGDLNLTLPEDCGFSVDLDAVSGKLHSDFPTVSNGDALIYGDGACRIDISGVSADVYLKKNEPCIRRNGLE